MRISEHSENLVREYGRAEQRVGRAITLTSELEEGSKRHLARELLKRRIARLEAEVRRLRKKTV